MRRLIYYVGTPQYKTICTTLASAKLQASGHPDYTITTKLETIEPSKPELSPVRKEMVRKFGFVSEKFKELI